MKGVVSSYQIELILPSVAETYPKMYPSQCNLQFSICRLAGGKVLSLEITIIHFQMSYVPPSAGHGTMELHLRLILLAKVAKFNIFKTNLLSTFMKQNV